MRTNSNYLAYIIILPALLLFSCESEQNIRKLYYEDGAIKAIESVDSVGKRQGESKYYYPSGSLEMIANYVNDSLDGIAVSYYESGIKMCESHWRCGKEEGLTMWYRDNGDLLAKETYSDGLKETQIQYKEDGTVEFEYRFDHDTLYFIRDCVPDCESGRQYVKLSAENDDIVVNKQSENSVVFNITNRHPPIDSMTITCDIDATTEKYYLRRRVNGDTVNVKVRLNSSGDFCLKCTLREYISTENLSILRVSDSVMIHVE